MLVDFFQGGKAESAFHAGHLVGFDFIHVMVATQHQEPDLGFDDLALFVLFFRSQHQRFNGLLQGHVQVLGHIGTGAFARGGGFGHGLRGRRAARLRRQCLGFFHVSGVVAARAVDDGVLTRGGDHLKLFAQVATNGAAVGRDGAVGQAKAVKNTAIGLCHDLVAGFGAGLVTVKAVGVFHDELTPAHQAKTGTPFVAKLGLNLVEVFGQLLVALDVLARDVGHHLFAGGLHHKVAVMPVFDAQHFGAKLVKATGLLPEFGGLENRHGNFDSARAVHLFAHDGFYLAHHAQTHRHKAVDTRAQFFDHAGAHHELVAHHLSIRRGFFEGGNEELRSFHGKFLEVSEGDAP